MLICRDEQKAFWRNLLTAKIMKKLVEPNNAIAKINKKSVEVIRYDINQPVQYLK